MRRESHELYIVDSLGSISQLFYAHSKQGNYMDTCHASISSFVPTPNLNQ